MYSNNRDHQSPIPKAWQWLRSHPWTAIVLFIAGFGLAVFSELAAELREGELGVFDQAVTAVVTYYQTPTLFWIAYVISLPLAWPFVVAFVGIIVLLLWHARCHRMAWAFALIPLLTGATIELLKELFHRHRPMTALIHVIGNSFPSGHAAGSVVTYGLLAYICWHCGVQHARGRIAIVVLAVLLIIATGLSRIYLQVHYPSDVVAGWAAGLCILMGSILLLERLQPH